MRFLQVFFCFLIFAALLVSPAFAEPVLEVVNENSYADASGIYHLVGEVQNLGNETVRSVTVEATFFDSDGNVVNVQKERGRIDVVLPERSTPFEFVGGDPQIIDRYELFITSEPSESKPLLLKVDTQLAHTQHGDYFIFGNVKNLGNETARQVKVVGMMFDANGRIVAVEEDFTQPQDIPAGTEVGFHLVTDITARGVSISKYYVVAESLEYSTIPEFGLMVGLVFAISIIMAYSLTRNKQIKAFH